MSTGSVARLDVPGQRSAAVSGLGVSAPALVALDGAASPAGGVSSGGSALTDPQVAEQVLLSFVDATGKLVPAAVRGESGPDATGPDERRRLERTQLLDDLRASAWAEGTLRGYGSHVRAWVAWCRVEGVPALPFDPRSVANFLIDYSFVWDDELGDFARDDDGGLVPGHAATSVSSRLMALNRAAEFVGVPRPGDNAGVKEVMRGIRRRLRVAPQVAKAALDLQLINRCLAASSAGAFVATRARAALLLRARTGATAGQLAKLRWVDVEFGAQDSWVEVVLPRAHRHGRSAALRVDAHRNRDVCVVAALRGLWNVAAATGGVFTHPSGESLTRQGLHAGLREHWEGLPQMDDRALGALMDVPGTSGALMESRDRALLLVGFYTALRRSNLSALNWGDVTDHGGDGLAVRVRWSKTDQEGVGRTVWVPQADPGQMACPASALRDWRDALSLELGREVRDDEPVFAALSSCRSPRVGSSGRVVRVSGDGINEAVQRLVVAAGITGRPGPGERNPFGAHSLRAGFVTEALRDDKLSVPEVMEVTDHKSATVVTRYRREVNAAKRNASRKLMSQLA